MKKAVLFFICMISVIGLTAKIKHAVIQVAFESELVQEKERPSK